MTTIELLALTKLLSPADEKKARAAVAAGNYSVDFNVHVKGDLEVLEDTEKVPTVSIPWTEVYALLREILLQGIDELVARVDRGDQVGREELEGFRRACGLSEDLLVDTIQEAFDLKKNGEGRGEVIKKIPEIKEAQQRALEAISRRFAKTPVKGKVNSDMTVEEIREHQTAKQVAVEVSRGKELICKMCGSEVGN
jgi:hypothetical protein